MGAENVISDAGERRPSVSRRRAALTKLFLVGLAAGLLFGPVAIQMARTAGQRRAVANLAPFRPFVQHRWGHVVRLSLGWRTTHASSLVRLGDEPVTDTALVHLRELVELERLELIRTSVTDGGLVHVGKLSTLKSLDLRDTAITDQGLDQLVGLTNLQHLDLLGTATTREGVDRLEESLPGLRIRWFPGMSDARLGVLDNPETIFVLELSGEHISDAGLRWLHRYPNVGFVDLSHSRVTDAGLVFLKALEKLEGVNLCYTAVTNAGMAELKELPHPSVPIIGETVASLILM